MRFIMTDKQLRKHLIRLAHEKPDLRPVLLPLITKIAYPPKGDLPKGDKKVWGLTMDISEAIDDLDDTLPRADFPLSSDRKAGVLLDKAVTAFSRYMSYLGDNYDWQF
jgi:hypothetical protein